MNDVTALKIKYRFDKNSYTQSLWALLMVQLLTFSATLISVQSKHVPLGVYWIFTLNDVSYSQLPDHVLIKFNATLQAVSLTNQCLKITQCHHRNIVNLSDIALSLSDPVKRIETWQIFGSRHYQYFIFQFPGRKYLYCDSSVSDNCRKTWIKARVAYKITLHHAKLTHRLSLKT